MEKSERQQLIEETLREGSLKYLDRELQENWSQVSVIFLQVLPDLLKGKTCIEECCCPLANYYHLLKSLKNDSEDNEEIDQHCFEMESLLGSKNPVKIEHSVFLAFIELALLFGLFQFNPLKMQLLEREDEMTKQEKANFQKSQKVASLLYQASLNPRMIFPLHLHYLAILCDLNSSIFSNRTFILKIEADRFNYELDEQDLDSSTDALTQLIERVKHLSRQAPLYLKRLSDKIINLVESQIHHFTYRENDFKALAKLLPGQIFPAFHYQQYSPLAFKIFCQSTPQQAYLLGFSLQYGLPSEVKINQALLLLSEIGPAEYLKRMQRMVPLHPLISPEEHWREEDILLVSFKDYLPFDTLTVLLDDKYETYTRPEWESIEKKAHDHIRRPASFELIQQIKLRFKIVKHYNLPPVEPYLELLNSYFNQETRRMSSRRANNQNLVKDFNEITTGFCNLVLDNIGLDQNVTNALKSLFAGSLSGSFSGGRLSS